MLEPVRAEPVGKIPVDVTNPISRDRYRANHVARFEGLSGIVSAGARAVDPLNIECVTSSHGASPDGLDCPSTSAISVLNAYSASKV